MNRMQNNKEQYFVHEKRKQKQRERETLPQGNEYLASSSCCKKKKKGKNGWRRR